MLPGQLRGHDDETPVQPWGISDDADNFQVRMHATNPAGRDKVKLEVEYVGPGVAFGGAGGGTVTSSGWTDATADGVTLTETLSGLTDGSLYRWRARVLYASQTVTEPGITSPFNPAHGPWCRLSGQSAEADIRIWGDTTTAPYYDIVARGIALGQNEPNPFPRSTRIGFVPPAETQIRLSVYDVAGRRIAVIADGRYPSGEFHAAWNGLDERGNAVTSSVYFARLAAGIHTRMREMVLLK